MRTSDIRFSPRMRWWFYSVFGILFLSGIIWLIAQYTMDVDTFEGPYTSLKSWMLKIHGAAAMVSLVILGVLIPVHMRRAWTQRRNQVTAVVMVTACLLIAATGYGLYYCGDEILRLWISNSHSVVGCLLPVVLLWHILTGRQKKRNP